MQITDFEDEETIKAFQAIMGSLRSKNKPLELGFCKHYINAIPWTFVIYINDEGIGTSLQPGYKVSFISFDLCKELMFIETKINKEDSIFYPWTNSLRSILKSFR